MPDPYRHHNARSDPGGPRSNPGAEAPSAASCRGFFVALLWGLCCWQQIDLSAFAILRRRGYRLQASGFGLRASGFAFRRRAAKSQKADNSFAIKPDKSICY